MKVSSVNVVKTTKLGHTVLVVILSLDNGQNVATTHLTAMGALSYASTNKTARAAYSLIKSELRRLGEIA